MEQIETKIDFKDYMIRVEGDDIRLDNDLINILYAFLKENVKDLKVKESKKIDQKNNTSEVDRKENFRALLQYISDKQTSEV